jgi:hypothetical protein
MIVNLKSQNKISKAVAGFRLSRTNGELYIGGTDYSRISGEITYSPVTYPAYYRIALGGVNVGATTVEDGSTGYTVIVDTGMPTIRYRTDNADSEIGATTIQMPYSMAASFFAAIPNSMPYNTYRAATGQPTCGCCGR